MTDIVERLGCLLRAEGGSRDHGLPEIVSAMRDAKAEIERLRTELERERAFKASYYGQLQEIFAKYKQWSDKPDGYVGDAPYWKGPSKLGDN